MPLPPPTRPHSANPHVIFSSSLFPASSKSTQTLPRATSMTGFSRNRAETEWEDAWDSSSDTEDKGEASAGVKGIKAHIPASGAMKASASVPVSVAIPARGESSSSNNVAASWASTSYMHVSRPSGSGGSPTRPHYASSKTYTEGVEPPPPGTSVPEPNGLPGPANGSVTAGGRSKLPPGGAWEIVDPVDLREENTTPPPKVGKEAIRPDAEDILKDPLQLLSSLHISPSEPTTPSSTPSAFPFLSPVTGRTTPDTLRAPSSYPMSPEAGTASPRVASRSGVSRQRSVRTERRREKFAKALKGRTEDAGVDLGAELRRLAWSGVPDEVRPIAWQLLLNYLPLPSQPRLTTLNRKRKEYSQLVDQYFGRGLASLDQQIWHQIEIDVPRTRPGVPLWSCLTAQRALERILYVWAIRHPASGYVQGINDLATPFFQVFLSAYIDTDPEIFDVAHLDPSILSAIEADSFWCLSKLLDGIQDNYISQQPGIQRLVRRMSELVKRIDAPLAAHFEEQGVEFMQFAFRWMNCLLMREMSVKCTIRMWDTYLAEGTDAFSQFHLYVCSALLVKYSDRLREMDFQEMIIFLQCLPTHSWTDHDVQLLLSEAYVLKTVWQGAENHFANQVQQQSFGMLGR